jgi:hypothetical protein
VKKTLSKKTILKLLPEEYGGLFGGIAELLEAARRTAAHSQCTATLDLADGVCTIVVSPNSFDGVERIPPVNLLDSVEQIFSAGWET